VGCRAEDSQIARLDGEIVRMLKQRICRHKLELLASLRAADESQTGSVSVGEWERAMQGVLQLDIPWSKYLPWLAEVKGGRITYDDFLGRYQIRLKEEYGRWETSVMRTLYDSLLAADMQMHALIQYFDKNGDGKVSVAECIEALRTANLGLSTPQIQQIVHSLGFSSSQKRGSASPSPSAVPSPLSSPSSSSGNMRASFNSRWAEENQDLEIDVHDYILQLTSASKEKLSDVARNERERWDLQQVSRWIRKLTIGRPPNEVFEEWDDNGDGYLDYAEFVESYLRFQASCDPRELDYVYTEDDLFEVARALDTRKIGRINYLTFASLFDENAFEDAADVPKNTVVDQSVVQHICTTIWANDVVMHKSFRCFDPDGSGTLTLAEFRSALGTMNAALADPYQPLAPQQIDLLAKSLPLNAEGKLDYVQFMQAFEVIDTTHYDYAA